jgi:hypothetical protein
MGKKRTRSSLTSKGERRSVVAGVKEARRDRPQIEKELAKLAAWKAGKNPWLSIPNGSGETNRRLIRVRANAYLGNPKDASYSIYRSKSDDK